MANPENDVSSSSTAAPGTFRGIDVLRNWLSVRRMVDFVFGYDFFISYKQDDGHNYPRQLANRLGQEGFRVFLDETGYSAGDDLLLNTRRRVRMSSYLILVGRPGALTRSDWVVREVQQSIESRNTPIVIDVDNLFLTINPGADDERSRLSTLRNLLHDRLRLTETSGTGSGIYDGPPSDQVVRELKRSFAGRRQDSRRARAFGTAAAVLAILSVAAIWFAIASILAKQQADREARRSRAGELAAEARLTRQPQLATLLATEAVRVVNGVGEAVPATARQALTEAVVSLTGEGIPGYGDEIAAIDFSADGRHWASGSDNGKVRVWETTPDGLLERGFTLSNPEDTNARFVAFNANASWLVAASDAGSGCFWSVTEQRAPQCSPMASSAFLLDIHVSPDRRWIAAAENKSRVLLWDFSQPDPAKSVAEIGSNLESVRYIRFSPDGRWLIAWGINNHDIWLWDLAKPSVSRSPIVLHAHGSDVINVVADPKGGRLASIDDLGALYVWELEGSSWHATQLSRVKADQLVINDLVFSTSGRWLVEATAPGRPQDEARSTIRMWPVSHDKPVQQPKSFTIDGTVRALDFSPSDGVLYIEGLNGNIWTLDAGNAAAAPVSLPGHSATVTQHAFSADSRFLATGDNDNALLLWDLTCSSTTAPIPLTGHEAGIRALKFTPDYRWLVSASSDSTVRRWRMGQSLPRDAFLLNRACRGDISEAQISPNEGWLASATSDGLVLLHDLTSDDPTAIVRELHTDSASPIGNLWFDPACKWLLASTKDALYVWDLTNKSIENSRRSIRRLEREAGYAAFTTDSQFAVVGSYAGATALIVDLKQKELDAGAKVLAVPDKQIDGVELSPDGKWLAAKSYDQLMIWDFSTPAAALPAPLILPALDSFISSVHFTRDSKQLIVLDNSARLYAWDLPIDGQRPPVKADLGDRSGDIIFSTDDRWIVLTTTVAPHLRLFRTADIASQPAPLLPKGAWEANGRLAMTSDGRWLAYASYQGAVQVWNTDRLDSPPWVVGTPTASVERIAFSKDGRWLAFGSDRGDVSIAEMTANGPLNPFSLRQQRGSTGFLGFASGNRWIISQSYQQLRFTPLRISELLELAARETARNLRPLEWSTYFFGQPYRKTFDRLPGASEQPPG